MPSTAIAVMEAFYFIDQTMSALAGSCIRYHEARSWKFIVVRSDGLCLLILIYKLSFELDSLRINMELEIG